MALTQVGYLGGTGPVFLSDVQGVTQKVIIQGTFDSNGLLVLTAKQPAYANNLANFGYTQSQLTLYPFADNQVLTTPGITFFSVPPDQVVTFAGYKPIATNWVVPTNGEVVVPPGYIPTPPVTIQLPDQPSTPTVGDGTIGDGTTVVKNNAPVVTENDMKPWVIGACFLLVLFVLKAQQD